MKTTVIFLMTASSGVLAGCSTPTKPFEVTSYDRKEVDPHLTTQVSDILRECHKIKPGRARAELLKTFTIEGGQYTARHGTFVYRSCHYINIDVVFKHLGPEEKVPEEQPGDVISQVSKPYLDWVPVIDRDV